MACVSAPASVHVGVRVVAKASSSAGPQARGDGIFATSHRRRGAVRTPTRWTAAGPFRGVHLGGRRAPAPAHVLYEPSRADVGSDDHLDEVAARAARDIRRRRAAETAVPERRPARRATEKTDAEDRSGAENLSASKNDAALAEAKTTMRAMLQTQAVVVQTQKTKAASQEARETRAENAGGGALKTSSSKKPPPEKSVLVEKTKTVPVAPRPGPARAADALKRLSLLNGTKTKKSKKPLKASLELKSPPVDAEAAAAVFGGGVKSPAAANGAGVLFVSPAQKLKKAQERKKEKKKSMSVANVVPAPTGSGAHKHQWDSFVDWKMMEHQDYETIPDAAFEKLSEKLHIKEKWRPMTSYLVSLGLTTKELEKCLVNCEEIFKRPVAKVMTRVEYLQNELGFEGAELKKLIYKEPAVLLQRNRHTVPRCRYLTELGVPAERLPTMLRKQPQILHLSVEKGLKPRVAYFKNELLIPEADIPKMLERNPAVLTFSIENQVQPRVDFLRDLGISRDGVMKMIVRHPHVLQYSFEGLEEHINFLSSIGMNEEDVVHTVTRLSQLFSLSVKDSLRPKFKYMTDELGGDHKTCVKFPAYFSLSLDQRIKPRHTYLKQYDCAPDPFPMKYLSENDAAFAARSAPSGGSLADFEEYREVAAARFKAETLQAKERAMESLHAEQRRAQMREARIAQQRRLQVQNQGYSQRIVDARNSMNRVRIIGAARKSR